MSNRNNINLSLLARGIGEIQKNGHEKVEVVFEPEDYYSWAIGDRKPFYQLPPLQPKYAFPEPDMSVDPFQPREYQQVPLPKTFITRRGALLLFSEDMALKFAQQARKHIKRKKRQTLSQSLDDLDRNIKTVDDLSKSILAYGAKNPAQEVNLRFVHDRIKPRKIRPGYSAKRYLSSWSRSVDDNFLEKLMSKGYIHERSIYHYNVFMPNVRRRIYDDLSLQPQPYRILKQMLMAPGSLSGYTFYRVKTTMTEDGTISELSVVQEEDGAEVAVRTDIKVLGFDEDGQLQEVAYEDLDAKMQENVLTDLLVKSAISQALKRQEDLIEELSNEGSEEGTSDAEQQWGRALVEKTSPAAQPFNMEDAVNNFLDTHAAQHIDVSSIPPAATSSYTSFRGKPLASRSVGSIEGTASGPRTRAHSSATDTSQDSSQRQFVGSVPVVSLRNQDISVQPAQALPPVTQLSPIRDMGSETQGSREATQATLNTIPVLPPIKAGEDIVTVQDTQEPIVVPSVPDATTPMSHTSQASLAGSETVQVTVDGTTTEREVSHVREDTEVETEETPAWGAEVDEEQLLAEAQREAEERKRQEEEERKKEAEQLQQQPIKFSKGPVLAGGSHLQISADSLEHVGVKSVKSVVSLELDVELDRDWKGSQQNVASTRASQKDNISSRASVSEDETHVRDLGSKAGDGASVANSERTEKTYGYAKDKEDQEDKRSARSGKSVKSTKSSKSSRSGVSRMSEQEVIEALTEHAQKIAQNVLSNPNAGRDLAADAKSAIDEVMRHRDVKSADPEVAEYQQLLRETLSSVLSKQSGGSTESIPNDAEVSTELIQALANDQISANDIEIIKDSASGKSVIRPKSGVSFKSGRSSLKVGHVYKDPGSRTSGASESLQQSIPGDRTADKDVGEMEVINYEADKQSAKSAASVVKSKTSSGRKAGSTTASKSSIKEEEEEGAEVVDEDAQYRNQLEALKKEYDILNPDKGSKSSKSSMKSGQSSKKSVTSKTSKTLKAEESKSKSSLEDRDEFKVGKVPDKSIEALYGQIESPPKEAKPKKPRVPKAASPKKKGTKKKAGKKKAEAAEPEEEEVASPVKEPTPPPPPKEEKPLTSPELWTTPQPSESPEMEFIVIHESDEDEDEPVEKSPTPEVKPVKSAKSVKSTKSSKSAKSEVSAVSLAESEDSAQLHTISSKDARAAKQAAQAAKRKEEVERKRRERQEQAKREREEAEQKERMQHDLEEERRRREDERKRQRLMEQEEKLRQEEAERAAQKRAQEQAERERRKQEEYRRKMEEMKRKQREMEEARLAEKKRREEEEEARRLEEEAMLAQMEEAERIEYERRKQEEEELRKLKEEADRIRREQEAAIEMEKARLYAEEMARRKAEFEARLMFNRSLQLESRGLEHTQEITRAFVWSYYELLQWLGIDLPEFEEFKRQQGY